MPTQTRDALINQLSGGRGYASLTRAQKDQVNNPGSVATPTYTALPTPGGIQTTEPKRFPVSTISTDNAITTLNKKKEQESKITPPATTKETTKTTEETKKTEPKPEPNKALDGTVGTPMSLEAALKMFGNNFTGLHQTADGQYIADTEAMKRIGITGASTGETKSQADIDIEKAKADRDAAVAKLTNFDVSNDPVLLSMLSGIEAGWNSRINEMERINKSRAAATRTTGVRTGSRYTGGAGGVFGSIIAEEEMQAVERIAGLEGQKKAALMEAKSAYETQQWTRYSKLIDIAQKKYDEQLDAVKELNKTQAEQDKKIKETERVSKINQAIAGLVEDGITDPFELITQLEAQGITATADEVKKYTELIKNQDDLAGLSSDLQTFEWLKKNRPEELKSMGVNTYLDYVRVINDAKRASDEEEINLSDSYQTARDFIKGNPDASREELKTELLARRDKLGLDISDINALLDESGVVEESVALTDGEIDTIATALRKSFAQFNVDSKTELNNAKDYIRTKREIEINGKVVKLSKRQAEDIVEKLEALGERTTGERILPGGK